MGKFKEMMQVQTQNVEPFKITVTSGTSDCLGWKVVHSENKKKTWLDQPHCIKNFRHKFRDLVKNIQSYKTPGTPGAGILKLNATGPHLKIAKEDHVMCRSGAGMLLCLLEHSRPDIGNAVGKLTKVLDEPMRAVVKEMKPVIKFALDTANCGLKIKQKNWTTIIGQWLDVVLLTELETKIQD